VQSLTMTGMMGLVFLAMASILEARSFLGSGGPSLKAGNFME